MNIIDVFFNVLVSSWKFGHLDSPTDIVDFKDWMPVLLLDPLRGITAIGLEDINLSE
jgi:hypothetical protein